MSKNYKTFILSSHFSLELKPPDSYNKQVDGDLISS